MGHYEFGEHADVYTQLMFTDYESVAQVAPGGNFGDTNSINCDNPLVPVGALPLIGCDAGAHRGGRVGADVHPAAQRRGRRTAAVVRELVVPHGGGRPWCDQRGLGLRRVGAVFQYDAQRIDPQLLRDRSHDPRAGRDRRRRYADLPVGHRRQRPELRALESVRAGWRDPGSARLPAGQGHPGRTAEPGDLQRRHHRRPRHLRLQDAVGDGWRAGGVRRRVPSRHARQQGRRAAGGGPIVRHRRRHDRHHRRDPGQGTVLRRPRAAGAGPGDGREPVARHRVPVFGLRRLLDRHVQGWPRVGADRPTSASAAATSVPFVPPTSSSCSPRRASTCST